MNTADLAAELERARADIDALRIERDEARSRLVMFYTVVQRAVELLGGAADRLVDDEAEIGPALWPLLPAQMVEAFRRLERIRIVHGRYAEQARTGVGPGAAIAGRKAEAIAEAWHDGSQHDPLVPLPDDLHLARDLPGCPGSTE